MGRNAGVGQITIGLFGLFGSGNSGNDGSLEAMLAFLRRARPDAALVCFCPAPEAVERRFGVRSHGIAWPGFAGRAARLVDRALLGAPRIVASWLRTFRLAGKVDLLIVPGTGILDDFGTGPSGMPYTLFRWFLCARLRRTRVWFVSIGAGPIRDPASRWLMKAAAGGAEYRSYRDMISRDFMAGIGFNSRRDPVYPDIAFKLPVPPEGAAITEPVTAEAGAGRPPLTIGVGVMAYSGWRGDPARGAEIYATYLGKIARFVRWLLDSGHRVRILTGDAADSAAVDDLMTVLAADGPAAEAGRLVAEPTGSLHELMRQIAGTDVVVATRFHNVVCALKLGRPTVSIGYARKNDALLAEMGLQAFCQDIESLDVGLLQAQVTDLIADRQALARTIAETCRRYERLLAEQDALLARLLPGAAPRALGTGPAGAAAMAASPAPADHPFSTREFQP
ncbi:polysaccharide pyruvyl transferase family protein [Arenibaculum pallidiluteum]|uniref:polysaccharide pyruvyl transferase family protein n=1 Tax=Arenibaculum pallidiluteum TaxID=2812559 RepID=UPI001A97907F|nr:polysaccharide pyruvyl transferase family protein [Arenibaculum pallidiluteum]